MTKPGNKYPEQSVDKENRLYEFKAVYSIYQTF